MDAKISGGNALGLPTDSGVIPRSRKKIGIKTFHMEGLGKKAVPYLMIAPAMIICAVFMVYPICSTLMRQSPI